MTVPLVPEIRVNRRRHYMRRDCVDNHHRSLLKNNNNNEDKNHIWESNKENLVQETQMESNEIQPYSWTSVEVWRWARSHHFSASLLEKLDELKVDGDLLLKLDEDDIRQNLCSNGIERKRFMRELDNLRSDLDLTNVFSDAEHLQRLLTAVDLRRYAYSLLSKGLSSDQLMSLSQADLEQVLKECGIKFALHRLKIIRALHNNNPFDRSLSTASSSLSIVSESELSLLSTCSLNSDNLIVVAFPRNLGNGSPELASLLLMGLRMRGFNVLSAENASEFILEKNTSITLVLALTDTDFLSNPNKVDPVLLRDIKHVLRCSRATLIPVISDDVIIDGHHLAAELKELQDLSAVRWVHDYQKACVDKLARWIKGNEARRSPFIFFNNNNNNNNNNSSNSNSNSNSNNSSNSNNCYSGKSMMCASMRCTRQISGDSALGASPY